MSENKRFTDSNRFIFSRGVDKKMYLVDTLKEFLPVELSDELAEVLSSILWEHYQLVKEKENGLFKLNNLSDFVRDNSDLDKDILMLLLEDNG